MALSKTPTVTTKHRGSPDTPPPREIHFSMNSKPQKIPFVIQKGPRGPAHYTPRHSCTHEGTAHRMRATCAFHCHPWDPSTATALLLPGTDITPNFPIHLSFQNKSSSRVMLKALVVLTSSISHSPKNHTHQHLSKILIWAYLAFQQHRALYISSSMSPNRTNPHGI